MVESKHQWKAWLYLSPAIVLLLIFTVWPIINTVRMAFLENYNGLAAIGGTTFKVGFGNFAKVVTSLPSYPPSGTSKFGIPFFALPPQEAITKIMATKSRTDKIFFIII